MNYDTFEYTDEPWKYDFDPPQGVQRLNNMGEAGWQLVAIDQDRAIFMRAVLTEVERLTALNLELRKLWGQDIVEWGRELDRYREALQRIKDIANPNTQAGHIARAALSPPPEPQPKEQ